MSRAAFDCDLLVVGLGPVGASLAGLAASQGLSVIAVDREADIYPLPRAAHFDHEVMRIFQSLGVADRIAPHTRTPDRYQFLTADRQVLLDFPVPPLTPLGWAGGYLIHQPAVERVLRDRLVELGVEIRLRTAFVALRQDAEGVDVTVESDGRSASIRARFVVGCDGAWSPVREAMGATLFDYGFDEPWLVLDALVEDESVLPPLAIQVCDPQQPTTCVMMGPGRRRWEFMLKPGQTADQITAPEVIDQLLTPWIDPKAVTVERKAVYRFHALVADRWRDRRVMIAGDAAHQMPPFAGQGMCSGIRDAMNLAWKIAAVVGARAPERLLDTYQPEREPHVRAIIETAIAMGRVVCTLDPDAAAARDADLLDRQARGAQPVSNQYPDLTEGWLLPGSPGAGQFFPQPIADGLRLDDALGSGRYWLIGRGVAGIATPPGVEAHDLAAPAMAGFAPAIQAWLAQAGQPAVLVRPDRYVFGSGEPAQLVEALVEAGGAKLAPQILQTT